MLAIQIPRVANSSCRCICILTGFVRINRMDARTNGLWSPSFVAASCPSEKTFKKKIIWVFRVAKGIQRYLMRSHMVANSCRGYFTVLWIETSSIRNTQYLTVLRVFDGIQNLIRVFPYGCARVLQYRWIPPNTIWELGLTLHVKLDKLILYKLQ